MGKLISFSRLTGDNWKESTKILTFERRQKNCTADQFSWRLRDGLRGSCVMVAWWHCVTQNIKPLYYPEWQAFKGAISFPGSLILSGKMEDPGNFVENVRQAKERLIRVTGPLHDPVTWYGINFQNNGTRTSPAWSRIKRLWRLPGSGKLTDHYKEQAL